jgi:intein/homing endonuclease
MRSRPDDASLTVYDLSVDGDHTYFANGFVVHNR